MPLMSIMLIIHFGIWAKNPVYPSPPNSRAASPLATEGKHYKLQSQALQDDETFHSSPS